MRNKGFTLAEVLLTLVIVGIIAALTIPSIIANTSDAALKAQWRNVFSQLNQATLKISTDSSTTLIGAFENGLSGNDNLRESYLKYLNYTKLCNSGNALSPDGCWASDWSWITDSCADDKSWYNTQLTGASRLVLNNGAYLAFLFYNQNCNGSSAPNGDSCGDIWLDVNGSKAPNRVGKDIFGLRITKNATLAPMGSKNDWEDQHVSVRSCNVAAYPASQGWSCSSYYLTH